MRQRSSKLKPSGNSVAYICAVCVPGPNERRMYAQSRMTTKPLDWSGKSAILTQGESIWTDWRLFGANSQYGLKSASVKSGVVFGGGFPPPPPTIVFAQTQIDQILRVGCGSVDRRSHRGSPIADAVWVAIHGGFPSGPRFFPHSANNSHPGNPHRWGRLRRRGKEAVMVSHTLRVSAFPTKTHPGRRGR